jgi:hypothetical protein
MHENESLTPSSYPLENLGMKMIFVVRPFNDFTEGILAATLLYRLAPGLITKMKGNPAPRRGNVQRAE